MIIGLSSFQPRVGKTTCANYLKENHGFEVIEMSSEVCSFCTRYLGYNGNKSDVSQRKILQDVGEVWKSHYPDIWIYHNIASFFFSKIGKKYENTFTEYINFKNKVKDIGIEILFSRIGIYKIAIAGIRSKAEADFIKNSKGKVLLIERYFEKNEKIHSVESGLSGYKNFNGIIINDSSIENLNKKIKNIVFTEYPILIGNKSECKATRERIEFGEEYSEKAKEIIKKYNIGIES